MDIVVDQGDIIYRYRCNERQCDKCPIRYICYTNKKVGGILTLRGFPQLDFLMVRARLDSIIGNQEFLCPLCYKIDPTNVVLVARPLGKECPICKHYVTCEQCEVDGCEFRNDLYNTDGDCLMEK